MDYETCRQAFETLWIYHGSLSGGGRKRERGNFRGEWSGSAETQDIRALLMSVSAGLRLLEQAGVAVNYDRPRRRKNVSTKTEQRHHRHRC